MHEPGSRKAVTLRVGDLAAIAIEQGAKANNCTLDVAGPEIFTFEEFIRLLGERLSVRCYLVNAPPRLAHIGVRALELLLRDVILTWDETRGLMDELLVTDTQPRGRTRFSDWLSTHAYQLGTEYTSYHERYDPSSESTTTPED
jgi:NADH dehydrogenase